MKRSESAIILFTLSPEAEGLRKPLGLETPPRAATLFATLIDHVASVCVGLPGADLLVATDSETALPKGARSLPQRGRDFGESLRLAFEDAFRLGYRRVVVIGNDAPEISRPYLSEALDELEPGDKPGGKKAVLGPAVDGGYNLLGLTAPCAAAFESMPWGGSDVARRTEARLEAAGFELARLRALDDIDSARGLERFLLRVVNAGARAGDTLRKLASRLRSLSSGGSFMPDSKRLRPDATNARSERLRAPPHPLPPL